MWDSSKENCWAVHLVLQKVVVSAVTTALTLVSLREWSSESCLVEWSATQWVDSWEGPTAVVRAVMTA